LDKDLEIRRLKVNGKVGYIDKYDKLVIPIKYDEAGDFSNSFAKVKLGYEEFYIDKNGNKVDKK